MKVTPGELLEALPFGKALWVSTRGRSMWPLLSGGESLHAVRCSPDALKPGDLAVLRRPVDGALVAHLVVKAAPFETASLWGIRDAPGLLPLAKVDRVRHGSREVLLAPEHRFLRFWAWKAWSLAAGSPTAAKAFRALLRAWATPALQPVRLAAAGEIAVHAVKVGEPLHRAARIALGRWAAWSSEEMERLGHAGRWAVVTSRGKVRGVGVREGGLLSELWLSRRLHGLGLEQRLLETLDASTATRARLEPAQQGFLAPLQALGFALRGETGGRVSLTRDA